MFDIVVRKRWSASKPVRAAIYGLLTVVLLGGFAACSGPNEPAAVPSQPTGQTTPAAQVSSNIGVKLFIANKPVMNKPVTVTATFSVGKDYYKDVEENVRQRIVLSDGIELVSGALEKTEDLVRGQDSIVNVEVKTVAIGVWPLTAEVSYTGPNARVENSKTYYIIVTDTGASFTDTPPEEGPPPTSSPPVHPEIPVDPKQPAPGAPIY